MDFFSAEHITYRYPNGLLALDDVSFSIARLDCVGLVGGNGAGKSTLLAILCGLLLPSSGTVTIDGVSLNKANLALIRNMIGMVFQNPDDQLFMPTVQDDVAFGLQNRGYTQEHIEQKVQSTLRHLEIEHLASRAPYQLSGGEKRSAAIATVLAMEPDILVMDEPSANLDPRARRRLIDLLLSFAHTRIIATHDLELVVEVCPRVIVLDGGKVVADGPTDKVLDDEALMEAHGLERPHILRHRHPHGEA